MLALRCVDRFKSALSNRGARAIRRASAHSRPRELEVLEGRHLLAALTVTTHHHSGPGSLPQAIIESHPLEKAVAITANPGASGLINASSHHDPVVDADSASRVRYYDTSRVSTQPVSAWQGIRGTAVKGLYLISGTTDASGLLLIGSINGKGRTYTVNYPGALTTSIYGPDNLPGNRVGLVGSYKTATAATDPVTVNGFVFQGTTAQFGSAGNYRTIDYPGAKFNYVHSTMGGLAVGNYDSPTANGAPLGPGKAYIYNLATGKFVTNIVFPGSLSDTAYGIWYNGGTSYTICGGYSPVSVNNMADQTRPIGLAYLVDYNSATGRFSHWTSFAYPNGLIGADFETHFESISSVKNGVYTLSADSLQTGSGDPTQGSVVTVRRNRNGTFGAAAWTNLNYPGSTGVTSSNSIYGNQVVGVVISSAGTFSYQATVIS